MLSELPKWVSESASILLLLLVIGLVISRLPKVNLGYSDAFKKRRVMNWLPAGLTYAFLYMGRYNLNTTMDMKVLNFEQFASVSSLGKMVYGLSFLLNGPLTDKIGGRKTLFISALGSAVSNAIIGFLLMRHGSANVSELLTPLTYVYAANMYFQSFGAVSIVKINSPWFNVKERGAFGGLFGILISLGLYFAYDIFPIIAKAIGLSNAFFVPFLILSACAAAVFFLVRDTPKEAGYANIELDDATQGDEDTLSLFQVVSRMAKNPAIITIVLIEFCSGYLRNILMETYKPFTKLLGGTSHFLYSHWGMMNCIAGITSGVVAGLISDRVFGSRRGPVAALLYGIMVFGSLAMFMTMNSPVFGWIVVLMILSIIGVHGMLSGTASMDFGGQKNTGVAVGVIDGFVYFGGALGTKLIGTYSPKGELAKDTSNWWTWPALLLPAAILGFGFSVRIWNAVAKKKALPSGPAPSAH